MQPMTDDTVGGVARSSTQTGPYRGRLAYASKGVERLGPPARPFISREAIWFSVAFWIALAAICLAMFFLSWNMGTVVR
jgi:hypothetical protein